MITIEYLGHCCFSITASDGRKILTDPYQGVGYELPKGLRADIVTVSHGHFDHNYVDGVACKLVLSEPQCYELEGITVVGIESYHDGEKGRLRGKNIVYIFTVDGITVCHLGDIGEEVTPALVEKIGKIDVLLVPVGGKYTVDAAGAYAYVKALGARVVIPMHYKPADGSLDIASVQPFLSLCKRYTPAQNELQIEKSTQGIYYMERAK